MLGIPVGDSRNVAMAGLAPAHECGFKTRWPLAAAAAWSVAAVCLHTPVLAETDVFQKAVSYVFTGQVDPAGAPQIADRQSCVVVMRDPKFKRYIRYHLGRFKMDTALYAKKYSGSRVFYELHVKGDDIVVEYLDPDDKRVLQGYRSAQIPLPGDIDQTRKALRIIFTDHCKQEKPQAPF